MSEATGGVPRLVSALGLLPLDSAGDDNVGSLKHNRLLPLGLNL